MEPDKSTPAQATTTPQVGFADGTGEVKTDNAANAPAQLDAAQLAALQEEYSHIISLIHLGFLDAKDYPMIPDELIHPVEEKRKMTLGEKITYNCIFIYKIEYILFINYNFRLVSVSFYSNFHM